MIIEELKLYTNNLNSQLEFYEGIMEFNIQKNGDSEFSVILPSGKLTFKQTTEKIAPYHFAFNIPSNKETEALAWLKQRLSVLPFDGRELVNFESWNAKAIYFNDNDGNILEFIARKNLKLNADEYFSSNSVLSISEIGLVTTNLPDTFEKLNAIQPIEIYSGVLERFCAVGDENGLFILVNPLLKKWFPKDDDVYLTDFRIFGDYNFEYRKGQIIEIV